jgi:hypothetical protein
MRGNAAVFVIGMVVAALVGIAAAFAMQSGVLQGSEPKKVLGTTDASADALKNQVGVMEQRLMMRVDELATGVEMLASELGALRKEVSNLKTQGPIMASPAVVGGEEGAAAPVNLSEAINRVLDDRDKRQEDQREADRAQRAQEMQDRMKEMVTSRTQRYGEEHGWDAAKTQQVNQIMAEYTEKMGQLGGSMFGRGGRRGGPGAAGGQQDTTSRDQMRQLMDDTKAKLLQVVSEEEANQLLQSRGGSNPGGMGGRGSQRGGGNRGGGGTGGGGGR